MSNSWVLYCSYAGSWIQKKNTPWRLYTKLDIYNYLCRFVRYCRLGNYIRVKISWARPLYYRCDYYTCINSRHLLTTGCHKWPQGSSKGSVGDKLRVVILVASLGSRHDLYVANNSLRLPQRPSIRQGGRPVILYQVYILFYGMIAEWKQKSIILF